MNSTPTMSRASLELGPDATEAEQESWFRKSLDAESNDDPDTSSDIAGDITETERVETIRRTLGTVPAEGADRMGRLTLRYASGEVTSCYATLRGAQGLVLHLVIVGRCCGNRPDLQPLVSATFRPGFGADVDILPHPAEPVAAPRPSLPRRLQRKARWRALRISVLKSLTWLLIGFVLHSAFVGAPDPLVYSPSALLIGVAALLLREKGRGH